MTQLNVRPRGTRGYNIYDAAHKVVGEINVSGPKMFHAKYKGQFVGIYSDYTKAFQAIKNKAAKC